MPSQLGFRIFMKDNKPYISANTKANRILQDRRYYRKSNSSVLVQIDEAAVTFVNNYFTKKIKELPAFEPESRVFFRGLRQ